MDRYKGDVYMKLLQKIPPTLMAHFLNLPREMQLFIPMKYFKNCTSNAQGLKINSSKIAIEVKSQEIWMEQDS